MSKRYFRCCADSQEEGDILCCLLMGSPHFAALQPRGIRVASASLNASQSLGSLKAWFAAFAEKARQRLRPQTLDSDMDCVQAAQQEHGSVQTGIFGTLNGPGRRTDDRSDTAPVEHPALAAAQEVPSRCPD